MLNPRRVLPHTLIYDRVWGYDFGPTSNALRVYVGYLRRKLEEAGAQGADPHGQGRRLLAAGASGMSLRARMALFAGVAVAIAVVAVVVAGYQGTRDELQGQVDQSLQSLAQAAAAEHRTRPGRRPAAARGVPGSGRTSRAARPTATPTKGSASTTCRRRRSAGRRERSRCSTERAARTCRRARATRSPRRRRFARSPDNGRGQYFTDMRVRGTHIRVLVTGIG